MTKSYEEGSIWNHNEYGLVLIVQEDRYTNAVLRFISLKYKHYMPYLGGKGNIDYIKDILDNYHYIYIGNINDLDLEGFIIDMLPQ